MKDLVLIGGGDHARVVLDAARSRSDLWEVVGFIDPQPRPEMQALGVPWLGDDARARTDPETWYIVAVGGIAKTAARRQAAAPYLTRPVQWATVIHQRAVVSEQASIGRGVAILAGAVVNPGAAVADHCIVNTGAVVEHDVRLEPFAHVGPGAVIGGATAIGAGAYVGLGARIRDHLQVGDDAIVGMGAVVVESVAAGAVVVGVPARPRGRP